MPCTKICDNMSSLVDDSFSFSRQVRQEIDEQVQRAPNSNYDMTLSSIIHVISAQYTQNTTNSWVTIEHRLHDLWYIVIQAAKSIEPLNPAQDTLIRHIMLMKAVGRLRRASSPLSPTIANKGLAGFSDGAELWSGLPLLARDLTEEFSTYRYYQDTAYDTDKRKNLSAFIGRLLSVGLYDGSALCALSLFRETLETSRPLVADESSEPTPDTLWAIEDLIYPLHHLVIASDFSLTVLSSKRSAAVAVTASTVNPADYPHLAGLGELAAQAGIPSSSTGFSPDRWRFWIQRLEELAQCGINHVAGDATSCLTVMQMAQEDTMLL
ncbi:hypothetical protein V2G26_001664 [Clonostachys chloroleuca]